MSKPNEEITDTAPLFWELQNVPSELIRELRRRSNTNNLGLKIPYPLTDVTYNFESLYKEDSYGYKGPMTPWVRVFSNSTGKTINGMVPRSDYLDKFYVPVDFDGFILKGGDGFFDAFGYDPKIGFKQGDAIIGYQANGKPHYIDGLYRSQVAYSTRTANKEFPQNNITPSILPPPGVTKISIKQGKEFLSYATVSFKCYGLAQLEYLTPFFLTAGINVFIEFGWNLFNQKSLVDLSKTEQCWELIEKPQTAFDRAIKSNGNYGCVTGIVTKYSFNTSDGFVYDCSMEVTSRQALFAGMRTDNNAKISKGNGLSGDNDNVEFIDVKSFFKTYLTDINAALIKPKTTDPETNNINSNFINYITNKIENSKVDNKVELDAKANQQQMEVSQDLPELIEKTVANIFDIIENNKKNSNSTIFYGGKPEDRVFIGRIEEIYNNKKNTLGGGPVIEYDKGTVMSGSLKFKQVSDIDADTDFDAQQGSANEVWLKLDLVFELANLFMSNSKTKRYYVDINNVVISAHPNLISCDKDVLIPNPVAPKINIGTPFVNNSRTGNSGYLKNEDVFTEEQNTVTDLGIPVPFSTKGNKFLSQQPDIIVKRNTELEKKFKLAQENGSLKEFYKNLTVEEGFYFACEAARKTFKTRGRIRDNLDMVINYLYYNSPNNNPQFSAAFPFAVDEVITKQQPIPLEPLKVTYKKYYYGYLKNLYISKRKLIDIAKSEETKGYKQFINAILNSLNTATENFWKFDIVEGRDNNGTSILSIVDKNISNFDELKDIYTFELASTRNVIKSIDFNVSLSPEQSVNVQYGGSNASLNVLKDKITEKITSAKNPQEVNATLSELNKIPFLKFADRMDIYQLSLLAKEKKEGFVATSDVPGTTSNIVDNNSVIENLQKYGRQENVLIMCVRQITKPYEELVNQASKEIELPSASPSLFNPPVGEFEEASLFTAEMMKREAIVDELQNARRNWKYLCLPNELRGKLLQMLDDGDYRHNSSKYSGVADNFTITLRLDGMFSFKNLQVFAINNLPKPYVPGNVIFQINEVEHEINSGKWETVITALVRCVGSNRLNYILV